MPIDAICEKCGAHLQADEKFSGKRARCRNCGNTVQLPAAGVVEEQPVAEGSLEDLPLDEEPFEERPVEKPRTVAGKPRKKKKKPPRRTAAEPSEQSATLRSLGLTFSVIGIGSFVLPYLGIQFKLVNLFGEAQSIVASLLAVVGAVLLLLSLKHNPQAGAAAAGGVLVLLAAVYGATTMWDPNAPPGGGGFAGPPPGQMALQNVGEPPQPAINRAEQPPAPPPAETGRATELLGGQGGSPFRHVAPKDGLLLGVHYRLGEWDRQPVVKSLRGVFAEDAGPQKDEQTVAAPDGYAVGGLIVDADKYVNAVTLVFMRVKSDGTLDPNDRETNKLIGKSSGRPTRTLAGDGTKVIGLQGRQGLVLDGVGLVLASDGGS